MTKNPKPKVLSLRNWNATNNDYLCELSPSVVSQGVLLHNKICVV